MDKFIRSFSWHDLIPSRPDKIFQDPEFFPFTSYPLSSPTPPTPTGFPDGLMFVFVLRRMIAIIRVFLFGAWTMRLMNRIS